MNSWKETRRRDRSNSASDPNPSAMDKRMRLKSWAGAFVTLMLQKSQKFGWQGGPKTDAGIVLEYVSEPVAGPTTPRRACAI